MVSYFFEKRLLKPECSLKLTNPEEKETNFDNYARSNSSECPRLRTTKKVVVSDGNAAACAAAVIEADAELK